MRKHTGLFRFLIPTLIFGFLATTAVSYSASSVEGGNDYFNPSSLFPKDGYIINASYGNLGPALINNGVIDSEKFSNVYNRSGKPLTKKQLDILIAGSDEKIVINKENAHFLLNFFWAVGLANKNPILDEGKMRDARYGGPHRFASVGGWTLGKSKAMDYYSKYDLLTLTAEEQALVERVSKNIYRPCCGNSTYFPDCNHGMAMLGLLELLASQGASEEEMYETALQVNIFWYPGNYLTIAKYFEKIGFEAGPKEILSSTFSSSAGFRRVRSEVGPVKSGGVNCGV